MSASSQAPVAPRRIAVFRALFLGDMLLCIPALRALRKRFPAAEITLIGLPWARTLLERYPVYIDRFVEFVGYPGIQEVSLDPERVEAFLEEHQAYGYDLVIQMHGSGESSNPFVLALGAGMSAGYYRGTPPAGLTFAAPYPEKHEIWRNLGLAQLVGCTELDARLEFPLNKEDYREVDTLLPHLGQDGRPWVAIHPGARPPARRWPASYFALVADELVQRYNAHIIFTGSQDEDETVHAVVAQMHAQPINLVGQTSLGGMAALQSKLDLFISNDTGPAHLACAVDCPSIIIFGPAEYIRWAPLDQESHRSLRRPVACSPCSHWQCPIDHRCLRWLSPTTVISMATQLLTCAQTPALQPARI